MGQLLTAAPIRFGRQAKERGLEARPQLLRLFYLNLPF